MKQNLIEIRLLGAGDFHADGQTDRLTDTTRLKVTFRNCVKALKTDRNKNSICGYESW